MKTDTQIQQDVIAELSWEPSVEATDIGVEVKNGVVTLSGHVSSYAHKWDAECAAQRVAGVKALAVEMDVKLPGSNKRNDADIAQSARDALQWTSYWPKESIKVKVEGGWVTLSGEVNWEFQRRAAASAVRYVNGVKGLSDNISIRPAATSNAVKADIEASLKRRAQSDANKISVDVRGNDVTLSGTVSSWSERELARHSAWGSAGVRNVVDNMSLTN
jgi:osmotically-inducible protein OsmY